MDELSPAAKQAMGMENTISDIRAYFMSSGPALKENEFKDFWTSLTEDEKNEFKKADLSK